MLGQWRSQYTTLASACALLPQGRRLTLSDCEGVEHIHSEQLAGVHDLACRCHIFRGRSGIAGGMVVRDNDRRHILLEYFFVFVGFVEQA